MPSSTAATGDRLPVPGIGSILLGIGGISPSGGFSGVMSGIGIGIGIFVSAFWMKTIGSTLCSASKLNVSDSTFFAESMSTLSAGCGTPTFTCGPQ